MNCVKVRGLERPAVPLDIIDFHEFKSPKGLNLVVISNDITLQPLMIQEKETTNPNILQSTEFFLAREIDAIKKKTVIYVHKSF